MGNYEEKSGYCTEHQIQKHTFCVFSVYVNVPVYLCQEVDRAESIHSKDHHHIQILLAYRFYLQATHPNTKNVQHMARALVACLSGATCFSEILDLGLWLCWALR